MVELCFIMVFYQLLLESFDSHNYLSDIIKLCRKLNFKGWIDEIRISKKARYGNIDIPTTSTSLSSHQVAGRGKNTLNQKMSQNINRQ